MWRKTEFKKKSLGAVITCTVYHMGLFYGALPGSHYMCSLSYGAFLWQLTWQSLHVQSIIWGFNMVPYLAVITCAVYPVRLFYGALPGSHYMYSLSYGPFLWCLTWQSLHALSILRGFSMATYLAVITCVVYSMGLFYGDLPGSHYMCSLSCGAFLWCLTWQSLHALSILRGFSMATYLAVITCVVYSMGLFYGDLPGSHYMCSLSCGAFLWWLTWQS